MPSESLPYSYPYSRFSTPQRMQIALFTHPIAVPSVPEFPLLLRRWGEGGGMSETLGAAIWVWSPAPQPLHICRDTCPSFAVILVETAMGTWFTGYSVHGELAGSRRCGVRVGGECSGRDRGNVAGWLSWACMLYGYVL